MTLNQEVPALNLDSAICEKSACAVGLGTLPKVVLDNDHLLSFDYELAIAPYNMLNIVEVP